MDILYAISSYLEEAMDGHQQTDPDYREARKLENRLLGLLSDAAGKELVEKLTDAQAERMEADRLCAFLCGLRLGVALLRL